MNISHKCRKGLPHSTFAKLAFAIVITIFVVVFEWADLKAGRETKSREDYDF